MSDVYMVNIEVPQVDCHGGRSRSPNATGRRRMFEKPASIGVIIEQGLSDEFARIADELLTTRSIILRDLLEDFVIRHGGSVGVSQE